MSQKRKSLKNPRNLAFLRQNGRCYYCHQPIWQQNPEQYAQQHGLSLQQAQRMQCTGEHLKAHKDGGPANTENIVAACLCVTSKDIDLSIYLRYRSIVSDLLLLDWICMMLIGEAMIRSVGAL